MQREESKTGRITPARLSGSWRRPISGTLQARRRLPCSSSLNATTLPCGASCNERNLALDKFELSHAQQVPKPPAPGPGVPPGNIPPLPPDIPVPDPAPPPVENPGDMPLPPITDPDAIEPGDPNPAHPPIRVRSVKRTPRDSAARSSARVDGTDARKRSNLFPSSAFQRTLMEANLGISRTQKTAIRALPRMTLTLKTGVDI